MNHKSARLLIAAVLLLPIFFAAHAITEFESPQERAERMRWFTEGRFGMFIHWGVYSQLAGAWNGENTTGGGENIQYNLEIPWSDYAAVAEQFDPDGFSAQDWVSVARDAGMKYIVITAKHHDGFSLYDSAHSDWDMTRSPYLETHVDPLKQLADEARNQGLRFGVYYSFMDWYHHGYSPTGPFLDFTDEQQKQHIRDQVTEIIAYLDPDLLWFDAYWLGMWTEADGQELLDHIRTLKPSIIVNNRVVKARLQDGDYVTKERRLAAPGVSALWESAFTMNDTWGYKSYDDAWLSAEALLHLILYSASCGSNHLLNIGPTGAGLIPEASLERLEDVGEWMDANGEAIYATNGSPFETQLWGWATTRPGKLYLSVSRWPAEELLRFPALENHLIRAYMLDDESETPLPVDTSDPREWVITLPSAPPDPLVSVVVADVVGNPRAVDSPPGSFVNDTDDRITYVGSFWYSDNRTYDDFMSDVHASTWHAPDDGSTWLEFEFIGTGIGYVTERNTDQGEVDVFVDGQFIETVDTFATIRMPQQEVFRMLDLPLRTHRIRLVKRSGTYFVVDGFRVYTTPVAARRHFPRPIHLQRSGDERWPESAF